MDNFLTAQIYMQQWFADHYGFLNHIQIKPELHFFQLDHLAVIIIVPHQILDWFERNLVE